MSQLLEQMEPVESRGAAQMEAASFPLHWRPDAGRIARWQFLAGLAMSLILLALAARQVNPEKVWAGLAGAHLTWVLLAFMTVLMTTAAKIARWRALFPTAHKPSTFRLGRALLIGQLGNALAPVRIGDVARAYAMRSEQAGVAAAVGTIATEKAFDLLFLWLSAGLAGRLVALPPWLDLSLLGFTAGGALLFLFALAWPERNIIAWFERASRRLPRQFVSPSRETLRRGLAGLAALRHPRLALTAGAWSAAIWGLAAATNYLLFRAFDLPLPPGAALLLLVLLIAGIAPPTFPGRLGIFHAITLLGLSLFNIEQNRGLAYATTLHIIVYLPQILPGAVLLAVRLRNPW